MKKLLLLCSGLISLGLTSQTFQYSYGTSYNEATPGIFPTSDNGAIMAGRTDIPVYGNIDATLIKTDALGNQLWSRIYGGGRNDLFKSVKETPNANVRYVAVGSTESYTGTEDGYFVGTDLNGLPLITKYFGGQGIDRFNHIQKIVHPIDGPGYIMVGETNSFGTWGSGFDVYLVRTDLFGNLKAAKVIGTKGDQYGNWVEPTSDGYIIAGSSNYNCTPIAASPQTDIYTVKVDFNLNIVWERTLGNNNSLLSDIAYCVKVDNEGNYVYTGETNAFGTGSGDAFLLKLTPAGGFVFLRTYGLGKNDQGRSLIVHKTAAGVFYTIAGYTSSFNSTANPDGWLIKTTNTGALVWSKIYGNDKPDFTVEINFSNSALVGYIVSGSENSFGMGNLDAYFLKTDLNGVSSSECEKVVYPTVLSHLPCTISTSQAITVGNNTVVPNASKQILYSISKCSILANAKTGTIDNDDMLSALQISPNPANDIANINVGEDFIGADLNIQNLDGKNLKVVKIEQSSTQIDLSTFVKGIYLIRIVNANGKMVQDKLIVE